MSQTWRNDFSELCCQLTICLTRDEIVLISQEIDLWRVLEDTIPFFVNIFLIFLRSAKSAHKENQ